MKMNINTVWIEMRNSFYSIFFALILSASFLWEYGMFKWLSNDDWFSIFTVISFAFILIYFIFDWIDANLTDDIDKETTTTDIVLWILAIVMLSIISVLVIKRQTLCMLNSAILLSAIFNLLVIAFRDKRINISSDVFQELETAFANNDNEKKQLAHCINNSYQKYEVYSTFIIITNIIVIPASVLYFFYFWSDSLLDLKDFEKIPMWQLLTLQSALVLFWFFNMLLKVYRNNKILSPYNQLKS